MKYSSKKTYFAVLFTLFFIPAFIFAESFYSPTFGFRVNLPEGYEYIDGNAKDRFSFGGPSEAKFDLVVYSGTYPGIKELAGDVNKRLSNRGSVDFFQYRDKQAAIMQLSFGNSSGWGLCVELDLPSQQTRENSGGKRPMLLALAYGPASAQALESFHVSALDSIVPSGAEQYYPGPVTEWAYPRGNQKQVKIAGASVSAMIRENDAEAAQAFVEREYQILQNYIGTPMLKEAWIRYYRLIFRDSADRVADAVAALGKSWGAGSLSGKEGEREFAKKALSYVQGFTYQRDGKGSDFLNLVSAVTEGRGDCDPRAMLWAMILANAEIPAAMMVSPYYSHAMGLADIAGTGARFEAYGVKWLVAETTSKVDIGLIAQDLSDPQYWAGIIFE